MQILKYDSSTGLIYVTASIGLIVLDAASGSLSGIPIPLGPSEDFQLDTTSPLIFSSRPAQGAAVALSDRVRRTVLYNWLIAPYSQPHGSYLNEHVGHLYVVTQGQSTGPTDPNPGPAFLVLSTINGAILASFSVSVLSFNRSVSLIGMCCFLLFACGRR